MHKLGTLPARRSKKHCKDDLACQHCCSCWLNFKKAFEVRNANLEKQNLKLKEEIKLVRGVSVGLIEKLQKSDDVEKQLRDLEGVKEAVRQELWRQVCEEKEVEDTIRLEKIKSLEQQASRNLRKINDLTAQNEQKGAKILDLEDRLANMDEEMSKMRDENEEMTQQLGRVSEQNKLLSSKLDSVERHLSEKNKAMQKITSGIGDIEGKYIMERAKANNLQVDKENLERNLQAKEGYISTLSKFSQENLKQIGNLQVGNKRLSNLVNDLDIKIAADMANEEYLKERLLSTEGRLMSTEGHLLLAQEAARFNSHKVEAMKGDLWRLKMTL